MQNVAEVKLGIVAVSRDCFPKALSEGRRTQVAAHCATQKMSIFEAATVVESENDVLKALQELKDVGVNALVVYLGNFGPEGPETMLAQRFDGPSMFVAAAEETTAGLNSDRGDAYCGMLNASYNLGLRKVKAYIPEYPVGTPSEVAAMISEFQSIARILIGLKKLKIFSFGPRPFDFVACNAPIKPLYDLGVEIQENSELDLFASFNAHQNDPRIPEVVADMEIELADGNCYPGVLPKLAQYEITLLDWAEQNKGASEYFVFANKCWPAFQTQFGFVPCFVNSRLAQRGIPISCETDIYGALSEYIITCATQRPATLLDINNTVPYDMYKENQSAFSGYKATDLFMGFHCGNTSSSCIAKPQMRYQKIMHSLIEPNQQPNITRGTLEGALLPGEVTIFRLQSTADAKLKSYIAEGEVIDVDPQSFGAIGVIAIGEMARFYRHVLIAKRYPHHAGVAFEHAGKTLYSTMKILGIHDVAFNQPANMPYRNESPFK